MPMLCSFGTAVWDGRSRLVPMSRTEFCIYPISATASSTSLITVDVRRLVVNLVPVTMVRGTSDYASSLAPGVNHHAMILEYCSR